MKTNNISNLKTVLVLFIILLALIQFGVAFPNVGIYVIIPCLFLGLAGFVLSLFDPVDSSNSKISMLKNIEIAEKFLLLGPVGLFAGIHILIIRRRRRRS